MSEAIVNYVRKGLTYRGEGIHKFPRSQGRAMVLGGGVEGVEGGGTDRLLRPVAP
jgi:hypothetical protein